METTEGAVGTVVPTGIERLDAGGGVLHRGSVTVLAGAPKMGKSALAISMILGACAPQGAAAAYFTSFYENGDLLLRQLARAGGREPARSSQRRHGVAAFAEQALRRGLHLYQGGGLVQQCEVVSNKSREAFAKSPGLAAVAVDPLLINTTATRYGVEERRRTLLGLGQLARELDVAVLLIIALSRQVLSAEDRRPSLQLLRGAGVSFEEVDCAMLLHRPAAYTSTAPNELAEVEIHRDVEGPGRLVSLCYRSDDARFEG
jgi:replicative DNA helicase